MSGITDSAKWFLFAVKADDGRRERYGRWISRLRRAETCRRRDAVPELGSSGPEISEATGHRSTDARSLEGVDAVVREVEQIRVTKSAARPAEKAYLIDYAVDGVSASSSLVQFALSEQVVGPAARYLGMVPILAGITVLASPYIGDAALAGSQLFHSDWEDRRQVKVFVHCTDVAEENGPLTAVSADASARVKAAVGYHYGGPGFRLTDEQVLPRVEAGDVTAFVGPKGAITFIDTSSCLHLGSRVQPGAAERLVVQFQYLTPTAFDLQLAPRRRGRRFADMTGDLSPVQRLVLGATG